LTSSVRACRMRSALAQSVSEWDQIFSLEALDLYWTSLESGATEVQTNGLEKDGLMLL